MKLLDLIFPKYCVNCKKIGDYLCSDCFSRLSFDTKNICLVCGNPSYDSLTHPRCLTKNTISGSFTGVVFNGVSKKLIYQFKYKPYLSSLKRFIGDLLYESLIQNEELIRILRTASNEIIFVPIPLSSARLRKRGYNQSEILAKELSKKFGFPVLNCLVRIKETRSQVGLNKKERKENIKDAFALKKNVRGPVLLGHSSHFSIKGKNVILVDDVLTSGATMSEACYVLKKAGAEKIWAIAFAKED